MKKLKGYEIRQMWLTFFKSKGHEVIESASLLPHDDPTLLWINAGVAPLKKYFDGREKPKNPRMCNAQKSIRTNDIDNVGRTSRHHTFFEMLGNFSIGDYFRDEVITWASELLFDEKWFGFPKDKIYITFYPQDKATHDKWIEVGVSDDHLIPLEGNFWEIGEGPCGPDTEIFYDRGEKYDPEKMGIKLLKDDLDNDRYIEIWNIVFSQFNSVIGLDRKDYPELPSKNIDTGSGLERLACIFQETETNYETDLFLPLIKFIENYTGKKYEDNKMAFRVIADHVRSVTFAVADGANLSNEGRGYVLRRILRRAVRYGRKLGITEPFVYKLVAVVVDNMKQFYGYLVEKQPIIEKVIKTEEENFLKTLEKGEKKISEIIKTTINNNETVISGKDAFLLYDTFGFPLELTEETASEANLKVDVDGFKKELEAQKQRARSARNDEQSMNIQNEDYLKFNETSTYVGYDNLEIDSKIIGLFKDGKRVNKTTGECIIVLEKTPFYAEMGGQIGDQGTLIIDGESIKVVNTFKLPNGQHAHVISNNNLNLTIDEKVTAIVDSQFHFKVCCNHSATHLINESLRKVLGNHVVQHGSLVTDERLRFDFNNYNNLTNDEILRVEELTNDAIKEAYPVNTLILSLDEAKKTGAQALFGEKYGDTVRVVDMTYSKELCGGTHVSNTSEIKKLAIVSIESKGSGIFRLEALTGENLLEQLSTIVSPIKNELIIIINKINEIYEKAQREGLDVTKVNISIPTLVGSYRDIIAYRKSLEEARRTLKDVEKDYDNKYRNKNSSDYKEFLSKAYTANNNSIIVEKVENVNVDVLKDIVDKITAEINSGLVFFANVINNSKVIFIAKSKNSDFNCGKLVKEAALITGGSGGGKQDFAQAGGKDVNKVSVAIEKVKELCK